MVELSCIIPTYNRRGAITKTLDALNKQNYDKKFEVIIVDDGSTDDTGYIIESYIKKQQYHNIILRYIRQKNRGPAAARNNGIKQANGNYILFLGDDMIPDAGFVKAHTDLLEIDEKICSLGIVKWHPDARNKKLKFLQIAGIEIDYGNLPDPENCCFNYFCTANIALARHFLLDNMFDEDFPYPAMEDTELGYRLSQKGLKIVLNKNAIVQHLHHYEERDLIKRQEKVGKSVAILLRKYPELKPYFIKNNATLLFLLTAFLLKFKFIKYINQDFYWLALSTYVKYKYFIYAKKVEVR